MPPVLGLSIADSVPGILRGTTRARTPAPWQKGSLVNIVQGTRGSPTVHCCATPRTPPKVDSDKVNLGDSLPMMEINLVAVEEDDEGLVEAVGMVIQAMEAEQREVLLPRILPQPLRVFHVVGV